MIEKNQFLDLLVQACPTFAASRNDHVAAYGNDLLHAAAGEFAHHLLALQLEGATSCFAQVGAALERIHTEGTPEVKELVVVGVLEGIQNVWGNRGTSPEVFARYLGPESRARWQGLNNFWSGQRSHGRGGSGAC